MNNDIKYFYGIEIIQIHRYKNKIIFFSNKSKYSLEECDTYNDQIDEIYRQNQYMIMNNIPIYKIILNNYNKIVTKINNKNYILFEIDEMWNQQITIEKLFEYQYPCPTEPKFQKVNWKKLWIGKIDYFEYQISQCGMQYPLIRESMPYFVGMAENAISMLNEINIPLKMYFQHRRISFESTLYDLMNPLNIIVDIRIRDICEYYKSLKIIQIMEENNKNEENIIKMILNNNFLIEEIVYFYIRLYFPTYYFDLYEEIISSCCDDKKIEKIVNCVNEYQYLLRTASLTISKYINIPEIEWIKKPRIDY